MQKRESPTRVLTCEKSLLLVLFALLSIESIGSVTANVPCKDTSEHGAEYCHAWASAGECEKNSKYMHEHCRRSCGLCDPVTISEEGDEDDSVSKCVDLAVEGDIQCRQWAWKGECETNPVFMKARCRRSCGVCKLSPLEESLKPCEDAFEMCEEWAQEGKCFGIWNGTYEEKDIDNAFVVEFCPMACNVCDIHLDDRDFLLNLGIPQTAPDIHHKTIFNSVKAKVEETRRYIQSLGRRQQPPDLQSICKMGHVHCARLALDDENCQSHKENGIMKYLCAAACQTCELLNNDNDIEVAKEMYFKAVLEYQEARLKVNDS